MIELNQWAIERAIESFGALGCPNDQMLQKRIDLFLTYVSPARGQSSREEQIKELVKL